MIVSLLVSLYSLFTFHTYHITALFFNKLVNVILGEKIENCDLQDTSLANKPKTLKMYLFYYIIGLIKLPPFAIAMENQNIKCVYLGN